MDLEHVVMTYQRLAKRYGDVSNSATKILRHLQNFADELMPQEKLAFQEIFSFIENEMYNNIEGQFNIANLLCLMWQACHDDATAISSDLASNKVKKLLENLLCAHNQARDFGNHFNSYVNKILVTCQGNHPDIILNGEEDIALLKQHLDDFKNRYGESTAPLEALVFEISQKNQLIEEKYQLIYIAMINFKYTQEKSNQSDIGLLTCWQWLSSSVKQQTTNLNQVVKSLSNFARIYR